MKLLENLLSLHEETLAVKNIKTRQELIKIMRLDYEKIVYSLSELIEKETPLLIKNFFSENEELVPEILVQLNGRNLYHIGFEINEPLDLVLYGFKHRIKNLSQRLGAEIKILRILFFPASQAFQNRVKAYADIMRIWLQVDNRELMLELFDIHHPVHQVLTEHRHCIDLKDSIWHYAFYVDSADKVRILHNNFKRLAEKSNAYHMPFESIIINRHDGSFLTKIINIKKNIEVEFVNSPFKPGPVLNLPRMV